MVRPLRTLSVNIPLPLPVPIADGRKPHFTTTANLVPDSPRTPEGWHAGSSARAAPEPTNGAELLRALDGLRDLTPRRLSAAVDHLGSCEAAIEDLVCAAMAGDAPRLGKDPVSVPFWAEVCGPLRLVRERLYVTVYRTRELCTALPLPTALAHPCLC